MGILITAQAARSTAYLELVLTYQTRDKNHESVPVIRVGVLHIKPGHVVTYGCRVMVIALLSYVGPQLST